MSEEIILYEYWRSSASYRVRIALESLPLPYRRVSINLLGDEQRSPEHHARNPQGLVPALSIDGRILTQSLAIIEYLSETRADGAFLPADAFGRQRVRALSNVIAMEIHPICNLRVVSHIDEITGGGDAARRAWMQKFIGEGLHAFEMLLESGATGAFSHGDKPTMADFCLVPQVYNAERWGMDMRPFNKINRVIHACQDLEEFAFAHPDRSLASGHA